MTETPKRSTLLTDTSPSPPKRLQHRHGAPLVSGGVYATPIAGYIDLSTGFDVLVAQHAIEEKWAVVNESEFLLQAHTVLRNPAEYVHELQQHLRAAFGYTERISALCLRLEKTEATLSGVLKKLDSTASNQRPLWVPIESFAPEPYEVTKPITIVVSPSDDGFEASFYDGELHTSGETEGEAISNLKATILDTFEAFSQLGEDRLGPTPLRQWKVLNNLIRRIGS